MVNLNDSDYANNSFTLFGPLVFGNGKDDICAVKIVLSVLLGVSMILSIVGNVCICAVIARDRTMRTPTNCYLVNLAMTDLLMSFFVPIEIYIIWIPDFYPLGEFGCRLHFVLLDWLCNCSLLIITAFTVERYLVVSRPFLRQKLTLNSRVFKIVGVIWIFSLCFCIPDIFYIDLLERKKYVFCYFTVSHILSVVIWVEIFVFFAIPMTTIFVLYMLIIIELKSSQRKMRNSPVAGKQNRDKTVKMLAAVVASFFIFWSPYCVIRVMIIDPKYEYEDDYTAWKIVNYLCYNAYISSAANPILYSLMSRKFRQAFKDLLKGRRNVPRKRNVAQ